MRLYNLFACLAYLLMGSSCTHHQFYSFTTEKLTPVANKGFVEENAQDSIKIAYKWVLGNRTKGNHTLLEMQNMGSQIVQIDWTRSALIVNDIKHDLFNKSAEIARSRSRRSKIKGYTPSVGSEKGKQKIVQNVLTTQSQQVVFPNSRSVYVLPKFTLPYYKYNPRFTRPPLKLIKFKQRGNQDNTRIFMRTFEKQETPLRVRFFLTYKVGKDGLERTVDQEFWVHELIESNNANIVSIMGEEAKKVGLDSYNFNKISVKKSANFPAFLEVLGGILGVGLVTSLMVGLIK